MGLTKTLRISKDFTVQTGSATADKAFIVFLLTNFFQISRKISNFLTKILGISKILQSKQEVHQLTRLLLQIYVTIFSNFKENKQFSNKNFENFQGFYSPNRKCIS